MRKLSQKEVLTFVFFILFYVITFNNSYAQYTLTDDDVVVTNGIIQSCSYDFTIKDIVIPDMLDGQTVVGIRNGEANNDGVFYYKGITNIMLPSELTFIGNYAFYENSITSLDFTVCASLDSIGEQVFCFNNISTINFNNSTSLKYIGDFTFGGNFLTSLDLSACTVLKFIAPLAFYNNPNLSSFILPALSYQGFIDWIDNAGNKYVAGTSVSDFSTYYRAVITYTLTDDDVEVVDGVIQSCTYNFALTDIIIPATLDGQEVTGIKDNNSWEGGVFGNKGITSVKLPQSLKYIGSYAFAANDLIYLDLSLCTALVSIEKFAFYTNYSLKSINFSSCSALSSISNSAFYYTSLNSIDLSDCVSLLNIAESAFTNSGLNSFVLPGLNNPNFAGWMDGFGNEFASGDVVSDFSTNYHAIVRYTLTDDDVIVTNGIIESCSYDFQFTDIVIPETLDGQSVIGVKDAGVVDEGLFYSKGITSLQLPLSMQNIGNYAFYSNFINSLDLSVCTSLKTIGDFSFGANSIRSLDISTCSELTNIGRYAFNSNSINDIDFSACSSLNIIGDCSFTGNSLNIIDLSNCEVLNSIGENAFTNNSITDITLPANLSLIGKAAFNNNEINKINGLDSDGLIFARKSDGSIDNTNIVSYGGSSAVIVIPSEVKSIGADAFYNCSIESVDLSECLFLESIGTNAFYANNNMDSFILPNSNLANFYCWVDYEGNEYPEGAIVSDFSTFYKVLKSYTLTDDDVEVVDGIIQSCSYTFELKNIIIPSILDGQNITGFNSTDSYHFGVFYDKDITSVELPSTITSIGNYAFAFNAIENLDLANCTELDKVGKGAFIGNSIVNMTLPETITFIGATAFNLNEITHVNGEIHNGIFFGRNTDGSIDNSVIISYGGIDENIVIPASVKTVGEFAFEHSSIISIDFSACTELESIGNYAFKFNALTELNLSNCNKLTTIGDYAFMSNLLESVTLPSNITHIGSASFNTNKIVSVNGETSDGIFYARNENASINNTAIVSYGGSLKNIVIPATVENIKKNAFYFNLLENVDFSLCTKLVSIDSLAFYHNFINDVDLSSCTFLKKIEAFAFDMNNLTEFDLPTPSITGCIFNHWIDDDGNQYAGGATVNKLYNGYKANLIGTLVVTFTVSDGTELIQGATVSFGDYGDAQTLSDGKISFTNIAPEDEIPYSVSATEHNTVTGTVTVVDANVEEDVQLIYTSLGDLNSFNFKVYPNPIKENFKINQPTSDKICDVVLLGIQGQKVNFKTIKKDSNEIILNINELPKGFYILKCKTLKNKIISRRIVKE